MVCLPTQPACSHYHVVNRVFWGMRCVSTLTACRRPLIALVETAASSLLRRVRAGTWHGFVFQSVGNDDVLFVTFQLISWELGFRVWKDNYLKAYTSRVLENLLTSLRWAICIFIKRLKPTKPSDFMNKKASFFIIWASSCNSLLGRTRSRGRCWAAIRLSRHPEPSVNYKSSVAKGVALLRGGCPPLAALLWGRNYGLCCRL